MLEPVRQRLLAEFLAKHMPAPYQLAALEQLTAPVLVPVRLKPPRLP
jgi:hypothetical protein